MSHRNGQQATASESATSSQLCPNQSERRLPVPVNITQSNQGKFTADAVIQSNPDTDNRQPQANKSPYIPQMFQPKPTHTQLKYVAKPSCRSTEYDSYEGRLATYYDWPETHFMEPAELARAGFYYTHYSDKVKCPYCFGGVYNWEITDNAFSEHVKHNPTCEYMKYMAYHCLTTPVPEVRRRDTSMITKLEDMPTIKAVLSLGYSLSTIQKVLGKTENYSNLGTDVILDRIFDIEEKTGIRLFEDQEIDDDHNLEGAVGGLNLNEENKEITEIINPELHKLQEEHKQLQKSTVCSRCHWRPIDCLFLPCRHLIACEQCTKDIENCLLCNQKIIGTTKVISVFNPNDDSKTKNGQAPFKPELMETEENIYEPSPNSQSSHDIESNKLPGMAQSFQHKVQTIDQEYERLKAEHKRLKKSTICNKCNLRPVDCLFLPCRHLVACEDCAEDIENCLECDQEIIGTVKVFLP